MLETLSTIGDAALPQTKLPSLDQALAQGPNTLLTGKQLAHILVVSPVTLSAWRCKAEGPAFTRLSRTKVRYRAQDVLEYLTSKGKNAAAA